MTKRIIGAFKTTEEALETIDALEMEGYMLKDLQIFTTNKDLDNLRGSTDALVESGKAESEKKDKQSLVDKVKSAVPFLDDPEDPSVVRKRLMEIGVSQEEALKYAPAGESGSIFIIADEDPDGNAVGGTTKKKLVVRDRAAFPPEERLTEEEEIRARPEMPDSELAKDVVKAEQNNDEPFLEETSKPVVEREEIPPENPEVKEYEQDKRRDDIEFTRRGKKNSPEKKVIRPADNTQRTENDHGINRNE